MADQNPWNCLQWNTVVLSGKARDFCIYYGAVEKIRQRRSHQFSVLTYWKYDPRAKSAAAFPSAKLRTGLNELF